MINLPHNQSLVGNEFDLSKISSVDAMVAQSKRIPMGGRWIRVG